MIVLDDYEGQLSTAPAMIHLRQLAEVQILHHPIQPEDEDLLKEVQVLLALRERTKLDSRFFEACPNLELVLQTGGHAYHVDNINDDGSIPRQPVASWLTHNTYRLNAFPDRHAYGLADLAPEVWRDIRR